MKKSRCGCGWKRPKLHSIRSSSDAPPPDEIHVTIECPECGKLSTLRAIYEGTVPMIPQGRA